MSYLDSELIIGGVKIPVLAKTGITQSYTSIGGVYTRRRMGGSAKRQKNWRKIRTIITAEGPMPPGLDLLNYDATMVISCAKPKHAIGSGLVYTLPTTRRTDTGFTPYADGYVDMAWKPTSLVIVANVATLTAVPSATMYRVSWYPEFTAYVDLESDDSDLVESTCRWSIVAEEA